MNKIDMDIENQDKKIWSLEFRYLRADIRRYIVKQFYIVFK